LIDSEADFKRFAGDLVSYGPIGSVFGANVSRRIGTRDIIPGLGGMGAPEYLHGSSAMAFYATSLMGPSYQVASDVAAGADKIAEGRYLDGAVEMLPKGLRDLAKAYKVGTEGVKDARGLRIGEDLDTWDLTLMAMGFNPLDYSKPREEQQRVSTVSTRLSEGKGKITRRLAQAYLDEDTAAKEKAMREVERWNKSHKTFPIMGSDLAQAVRRKVIADRGYATKSEYLIRRELGIPLTPRVG